MHPRGQIVSVLFLFKLGIFSCCCVILQVTAMSLFAFYWQRKCDSHLNICQLSSSFLECLFVSPTFLPL